VKPHLLPVGSSTSSWRQHAANFDAVEQNIPTLAVAAMFQKERRC